MKAINISLLCFKVFFFNNFFHRSKNYKYFLNKFLKIHIEKKRAIKITTIYFYRNFFKKLRKIIIPSSFEFFKFLIWWKIYCFSKTNKFYANKNQANWYFDYSKKFSIHSDDIHVYHSLSHQFLTNSEKNSASAIEYTSYRSKNHHGTQLNYREAASLAGGKRTQFTTPIEP